jgi:hypothetical protein
MSGASEEAKSSDGGLAGVSRRKEVYETWPWLALEKCQRRAQDAGTGLRASFRTEWAMTLRIDRLGAYTRRRQEWLLWGYLLVDMLSRRSIAALAG